MEYFGGGLRCLRTKHSYDMKSVSAGMSAAVRSTEDVCVGGAEDKSLYVTSYINLLERLTLQAGV